MVWPRLGEHRLTRYDLQITDSTIHVDHDCDFAAFTVAAWWASAFCVVISRRTFPLMSMRIPPIVGANGDGALVY